ncbi:MAG: zinc-binding dehydrogenase [Candidatus Omnitrophota bacterium]
MPVELCIQNRKAGFRQVEQRPLRRNEIRIKTQLTGLRHGDDLFLWKMAGWNDHSAPVAPLTWGVGEVVEVGSEVDRFAAGDMAHGPMPHRDYHIFQQDEAYPLAWLKKKFSVFADPGAAALRCIHASGLKYGDRMAIFGMGAVGLMAAQYALASGAGEVIAVDPLPSRLKTAQNLGAHTTIQNSLGEGDRWEKLADLDSVVELSGTDRGLSQCIQAARCGGTVTAGGLHYSAEAVEEARRECLKKGTCFIEAENYPVRADLERIVLKSLADKTVIVWPILSHVYSFQNVSLALQKIEQEPESHIKVLLEYD